MPPQVPARPSMFPGVSGVIVGALGAIALLVFCGALAMGIWALRDRLGSSATATPTVAASPTRTGTVGLLTPTQAVIAPTATQPGAATTAPAATKAAAAATPTTAAPAATVIPVRPSATATALPVIVATPTTAPATSAVERPTSGRIAFTEYYGTGPREAGKYDIYLANVDSSDRRRLAQRASEPVFSPDGRRLAFYSWDEGGVFVMNPDGSGRMRVSPHGNDAWPTWSPDQTTIAYAAMRGGCTYFEWISGNCYPPFAIYSIPIGGRTETNIIDGEQPSWGPDGRIVYKGCLGANCGLMVVNPANKAKVRITTHANDSNPIWSHATGKIVFSSDRAGNWDVWIVNADGTGLRQLTTSPENDGTPTWSVDGDWVFFRSSRGGEWAVWAMRPDGSSQVKLFPSRVSERWYWERVSAGR